MPFPVLPANGSSAYNLTKSLRFRNSASAYLNRTYGTPTNRQKWTWSGWVKRGLLGVNTGGTSYALFGCDVSGDNPVGFLGSDKLTIQGLGGGAQIYMVTTQVFRDTSNWYHIVIAYDATQATASDRVKLYVNGSQVTAFDSATYPAQNNNGIPFNTAVGHSYGKYAPAGAWLFDGYMAEVYWIDGQALTPSSFGSTNSTTGVWQPAAYTGTYGANGSYLKFTNTTSTATLGNDFSGNSNTWTTNNFSLTNDWTYDSMTDVPTLTSATTANYSTLNPVSGALSGISFTNGNLNYSWTSNVNVNMFGSMAQRTGKLYVECLQRTGATSDIVQGFVATSVSQVGQAVPANPGLDLAPNANFFGYTYAGRSWNFGTQTNGNPTLTVNTDTLNFAIDFDAGKAWVGKNGTWFGSGNPATGANPWWTFTANTEMCFASPVYNATGVVNFGQRPWANSPPTGFNALNAYNVADSAIVKGNKVMDATTFTATGTTQSITNTASFKPDLVWGKTRSPADNHYLWDSVRGVGNYLEANATQAEVSNANTLTSFNSNGWTMGTQNWANGSTVVGWQWQAGQGSSSSNTSGTITSTVSVNASAGFSIITYTGNGTAGATIGHGLGVAPKLFIVKTRSITSPNYGWQMYHASLGATKSTVLNLTSATITSTGFWNDTAPTSSVITLGNDWDVNKSATTYVAYAWSQIPGFSSFGSYIGNGNADGTFIYTGFRPKFVMTRSSSGSEWVMLDSARDPYNYDYHYLYADSSSTEGASFEIADFLSNGFKIRSTWAQDNTVNQTYIYMAFAENPFKNALAR